MGPTPAVVVVALLVSALVVGRHSLRRGLCRAHRIVAVGALDAAGRNGGCDGGIDDSLRRRTRPAKPPPG